MNLHDLVSELIIDTKGAASGSFLDISANSSLRAFLPELLLCATILLMLFLRLFKAGEKVPAALIALLGSLAALYYAAPWENLAAGAAPPRMEIFTGMLVYDGFSIYVRSLLFLFAGLFAIFTWLSGIPDHSDGPDVMTLVMGATLNVLDGLGESPADGLPRGRNGVGSQLRSRRLAERPPCGSEAALKYAVYGAGAAGVMLYGISLLAGIANTAHLPTVAVRLAEKLPTMNGPEVALLALAAC